MNTTPDPIQEWAGLWLRGQHQCLQRWAQSCPQPSDPEDLTALAVQIWQQGCELWLNNIGATLPANFLTPVITVLKQSQDDLHQALKTAQRRQQTVDQPNPSSTTSDHPGPELIPLNSGQNFDLSRLKCDPAWRENIQAINAYIQFHIRMAVESLELLKVRLASCPEHGPELLTENPFGPMLSDYQAKLQSAEYRQVLERLITSLTAVS